VAIGCRIVGHQLVPIANNEFSEDIQAKQVGAYQMARHLTALVRYFRRPVQVLAQYGLIARAPAD
jgi:hypothetical protein